jgi:uncharacterized membrane protein
MKKLIRILAAVSALVLVPVAPAFAYDFVPTGYNEATSGKTAFTIEDMPDGATWISLAVAQNVATANPARPFVMCQSLTKDDCATSNEIFGTAILPVCGDVLENCIAGLKIYKSGEAVQSAKYVKNVAGFTYPTESAIGNPRGDTPSIWESSLPNAGGVGKYVVSPHINFMVRNGVLRYTNFSANVFPFTDKYGRNYRPAEIQIKTENGYRTSNHDNGENTGNDQCVATDVGWCAYRSDFASGTRVELDLKLSNKVTGWLHGRLTTPEIAVNPIDDKFNSVSIAGDPVSIPMMYAALGVSSASSEVQTVLNDPNHSSGGLHGREEWRRYNSDDRRSRTLITALASSVRDTAAETYTSWQVKSINDNGDSRGCLADTNRLVGLVTTNAMAYSGTAPEWKNNTLAYEVAGLHFMPDGKTPVEGTYDLAIRSDVARCLYGFSKAPISATINVTGANGETKTATTVVSEKDGWLKLAAYGFTFSSPTISVKLTQTKVPAKKTTITCVKGKLTKKVTAVGPKCPAGYKKK